MNSTAVDRFRSTATKIKINDNGELSQNGSVVRAGTQGFGQQTENRLDRGDQRVEIRVRDRGFTRTSTSAIRRLISFQTNFPFALLACSLFVRVRYSFAGAFFQKNENVTAARPRLVPLGRPVKIIPSSTIPLVRRRPPHGGFTCFRTLSYGIQP